jgi:endonuclease/exonuclease/phosphatase (EEP) superfamily protein YafD
MRFVRLAFWSVFAIQALMMAGLSAGAAVASLFGRTSLDWDILAHFAPIWLVGSTVSAVLALVLQGYVRAIVMAMALVGVAAAGSLIVPEFLRNTGPKAPPNAPDQLKVVQFNVWHSNTQLERVADWLVRENPDVVIFEESRSELREAVEAKGVWRLAARGGDVTIYSKTRSLGAKAKRSGEPIASATFRDRHGRFSVVGAHYDWPTDMADQQAQEQRLAQAIAVAGRERTIVAGDFNSTPWSFSRRRWDKTFGLIRRDRAVFTWPAMQYKRLRWLGIFPFLPIDHVYAGSGWATVKVERGPRLGSDHYPVIVTLAPAAPR